jgi:hypothetical protein
MDLQQAYSRKDKVTLQRSLSDPLFAFLKFQMDKKQPSPFFNGYQKLKLMQARIYNAGNHFMPEEQWAQILLISKLENLEIIIVFFYLFDKRVYF